MPLSVGAHAGLESSDPRANTVVNEAPGAVTMRFTEPLEPSYSKAELYDQAGDAVPGTSVAMGDDEYELVLSLPPDLPHGTYSVLWRTLSTADGHTSQNYFSFTVGSDVDVAPVAIPSSEASLGGPPQWLKTLSRWVALVGLAALVAVWPVWVLVLRPSLRPMWRSARDVTRRMRRYSLGALALAVGGSVLALVVQAMTLPDGSLPERVLDTLDGTRYGRLWLARVALMLLAGGVLWASAWWSLRRRRIGVLAWLVTLALPVPFSLIAHASAQETGRTVAVVADYVHLLAASLWVGGLLMLLAVLLPALRGVPPGRRRAVLAVAVPRFSVLGLAGWAVLGLTGLYAGWLEVGNLHALRSTAYGQALIVKLALLVLALVFAAVNLLVIGRRLRTVAPGVSVWTERLRWSIALETLFVLGALVAVGQMTSLEPAREALARQGQQMTITFPLEEGDAQLLLAPGAAGVNHFRLEVSEDLLQPDTEALLRLTLPSQDDIGTKEIQASRVSGNAFEHHGSELGIAGDWEITLILRTPDAMPVQAVTEATIPASAPKIDLPSAPWRFSGYGGTAGLLLILGGVCGAVAGIAAGNRLMLRESVGIGAAAVLVGAVLLLQARVDPALTAGPNGGIDPGNTAMVARGEAIYTASCQSCHGAELRGNGPAASGLVPPPADFSAPHTMVHSTEDLVYWIRHGKQGTAMPAFDGELSDRDIRDVLAFIQARQQAFRSATPAASP